MSFGSRPNFPVDGTINFGDTDEYNRRIAVGQGTVQVNGHDVEKGESVVVDKGCTISGKGYVFVERTKDEADSKVATPKDAPSNVAENADEANETSPIPSFTPDTPAKDTPGLVTDEDKEKVKSDSSKSSSSKSTSKSSS